MTRLAVIEGLDARNYARHALHRENSDWPEKNCYADLWIELLHALELEPLAMLGHTLAVDFEGDQWTFFKPPHAELRELYGIDVQEMTVWRPLVDHVLEHLATGKLVSTEADSFWLPDTAGTDYRSKHTKTTILVNAIDIDARRLGYLHNAGYFELEGEDFDELFRPGLMPLLAELVRIDRRVQRSDGDLKDRALRLLRNHYEWRPRRNPFAVFGQRLAHEIPAMREAGLAHYHAWAFATIRQAGAAFELAAAHLQWLRIEEPAAHFREISAANKSLILKGARTAATGKLFDANEAIAVLARAWDDGMRELGAALL
jgi:hypothetical protein